MPACTALLCSARALTWWWPCSLRPAAASSRFPTALLQCNVSHCSAYPAGSCNCTQCDSGWQVNSSAGGCEPVPASSTSTAAIAGAAAGVAVPVAGGRWRMAAAFRATQPACTRMDIPTMLVFPSLRSIVCLPFPAHVLTDGGLGGGQDIPGPPSNPPAPALQAALVPGLSPSSSALTGSHLSAAAGARTGSASGGPSPAVTASVQSSGHAYGRQIVEEDWADAQLATALTRPAGLPPESLFSHQAPPAWRGACRR